MLKSALMFFSMLSVTAAIEDKASCEDNSAAAVQASAMLQTQAESEKKHHHRKQNPMAAPVAWKAAPAMAITQVNAALPAGKALLDTDTGGSTTAFARQFAAFQEAHLEQARACTPVGLQEAHLKALRRHAALMALDKREAKKKEAEKRKAAEEESESEQMEDEEMEEMLRAERKEAERQEMKKQEDALEYDGSSAPLDAAGFKAVTSLCCPAETESFFIRLLHSMGLDVCSKPHVQGLMHWFTCVPDMDFEYMLDVIRNGNPCLYWAPIGQICPALSPQCAGAWCR